MDSLEVKYTTTQQALQSLHKAIIFFDKAKQISDLPLLGTHCEIYQAARDSIIQRFKFSVELFWKYLRLYLEEHEKVAVEANTPRAVIRATCLARIISEEQAAACIAMIDSLNLTSHIYKEDIAEQLVRDIPAYYVLMKKILDSIQPL